MFDNNIGSCVSRMKMRFPLPVGMLLGCLVMNHFSKADDVSFLTNVDYIGLGYDIYTGNPHADAYDIGFRNAVINLTYTADPVPNHSSDFKWIIPDNTQALQVTSCSGQTDSKEISGMTSYQNPCKVMLD